jgi:hypothetical protein
MVDFITTATGRKFHFENPQPEDICLADIAYSLAHTPRWGAHANPQISVGQHSVMVADALLRNGAPQIVQLQGLFHDSAEAYLGDIPTPIKARLPEYRAMELIVTGAIFDVFRIPLPMDQQVHLQDFEMRRWEYRDLMPGDGVEPPLGNHPMLKVWSPVQAEESFLGRYYDLALALDLVFNAA